VKATTLHALRAWLLPVVLVLNGAMSLAIADRAAELRRGWLTWDLRLEARSRLKLPTDEEGRPRRLHGKEPTDPPGVDAPPEDASAPEDP